MTDTAIEFQHVWKKFKRGEKYDSLRDAIPAIARRLFSPHLGSELHAREFWALQDVSFQVARGEALGIVGPNGSGKSTTLKLLSRILQPDRGQVSLQGRLSALIELGAGFHQDLTGRENIYLNAAILGMKKSEIERKFEAIVEFSELQDALDTPVKRYSSGMYARLGFSVAAHVDPEVLLVDEVLGVGDFHFQQKCFSRMRHFIQQGTSIVFVSHNLTAVSNLCHRVLVLRKGEAIFLGEVATGIQKYFDFYEEEVNDKAVEVTHVRLKSATGEERSVFQPGEAVTLEIGIRARQEIRGVYAGLTIHTMEGQFVFDTSANRLTGERMSMNPGDEARIVFALDMNLQSGVFLLGFDLELPEFASFLYHNPRLKRIVLSGDHRSRGYVHLNPRVEVTVQGAASRAGAQSAPRTP